MGRSARSQRHEGEAEVGSRGLPDRAGRRERDGPGHADLVRAGAFVVEGACRIGEPERSITVEVTSRSEGDFTIVAVVGEVDLYSSPKMREAVLSGLSRKRPNVVVDLSGVSYMDSSGIATLVEALQVTRKHSGRLVLAGLTERVREVFELTRLHSVFELVPTVEDAIGGNGEAAGS